MNTLSRRCGAPTLAARRLVHCASNPAWASSPRTWSSPRARSCPTFSTTTNFGPTSRTARENSNHRLLRRPRSPVRLPALLMSWQGKPPHRTETGGKRRTAWMSPRLGTPGHHRCRTWHAYGSTSLCHATSPLKTASVARSSPPMPLKREPILALGSSCLRSIKRTSWRCGAGTSRSRRRPSSRAL